MAQATPSLKQLMINKANTTIVAVTSVACFVAVFSLVASYALIGQLAYQGRVIDKKKTALKTLKADIEAVDTLKSSYLSFISTSQNVIGGSPTGGGDQDGDNAKIILDALPSKYDFPALTASVEKIVTSQGATIEAFNGVDDEVTQSAQSTSASPQVVEMPFEVTVKGPYPAIQNVLSAMQRSIRPIHVQSLTFTAQETEVSVLIKAKSYYQPSKVLEIRNEVVK